ncbi:MAG: putative bifunctional diguanylate cyclase/phosphodiesterase [Thermoleophilaceae bacterium]
MGAVVNPFERSPDLLATTELDGRFSELSPAWEATLGWTRGEMTTKLFMDFVHPDDRERTAQVTSNIGVAGYEIVDFENRFLHRDGGWRWLLWSARSDGKSWYTTARDVTERKRLELRAIHDPLTGLPNRALLIDRLGHALDRVARTGGSVSVLFVDLDRFKAVNDTRGHETGDFVLVAAARRLEATVRAGDTVGRLGGDEFVVLAEDLPGDSRAHALAARIVEAFTLPLTAGEEEVVVGASIGIVAAGPSDERPTPERLLREADTAMYRAKAAGRGRAELFDDLMREEVAERLELARELRKALPRKELRLVYQPVVSLADGQVVACEALLRWHHPERGVVPPAAFVPLAEQNGLILPIGEWVLEEACRQGAEWRRAGRNLSVSVNISPAQLAQPDFAEGVDAILRRAGLPAQCLCLELVESTVARQPERIGNTLRDLRAGGVRIALDDFGKGATSLAHFRGLPLDILKLDRTFVSGLREGDVSRAIVAALLSLAKGLGITVVAEGVEREDQAAELRELGCGLVQGFWFGRPTEPENLELEGFNARARPGLGDPFVIREFMRQIGIPARIQ